MPEPTSQCVTGTCVECVFWKAAELPAKDESAEYQGFRRCSSSLRPGLVGRQVLDERGRIMTAPSARCGYFSGRGGER